MIVFGRPCTEFDDLPRALLPPLPSACAAVDPDYDCKHSKSNVSDCVGRGDPAMTPVQRKSGRRLAIKRSVESVIDVNVAPAKRKRVTLAEYRQLDARLSSAKTTIALIHTKLSQTEDDYNRLNALLERAANDGV